jgi:hypothetical protein
MVVTPAKAGVQNFLNFLDSRLRRNDRKARFLSFIGASVFSPIETVYGGEGAGKNDILV